MMKNQIMIFTIIIVGIGSTSAYAITSTDPYLTDANTTHVCGTDITNNAEYSCAVADTSGYAGLFTKVKESHDTTVEAALVIGQAEFTTMKPTVTFNGIFDIVGTIKEPGNSYVTMIYGVELQKKSWWGTWSPVGYCNDILHTEGIFSIENKKIQCAESNSGTNTYRVIAYAESVSQSRGVSLPVYADFYTDSNKIIVNSISVW